VQVDGGDQGSHLREYQPHQHGHYVLHKNLALCTPDFACVTLQQKDPAVR
jgi:hypothetical protein